MKYAILVALFFVLQACSVAHAQPITEQVISMPRELLAEIGDACIYLAQTLFLCPSYLTLIPVCGICFALPVYLCCLPLVFPLFCCGFMLPLLESLCFELPAIIARALLQRLRSLFLTIKLCTEVPCICLQDLSVMLAGIPQLCRICLTF